MLTDMKVRAARARDKRYQITDSGGLCLEVMPTGKKYWRLRYSKNGKRSWHTIGEYPAISLIEARERQMILRQKIRDGKDLDTAKALSSQTFQDVALQWHQMNLPRWTAGTARVNKSRLEMHVFPFIGTKDIKGIATKEMLEIARRLEAMKQLETSRRVVQVCSQVFRYAIIRELCDADPTYALKGELLTAKVRHHSSLTDPREVAKLMRKIDAYPRPIVRYAMLFSALTFCRQGDICDAEWTEINFTDREWRIPEHRPKMKRPHIVPLAKQTMQVLEKMQTISGHGRCIFPSNRSPRADIPMSKNTVLMALRAMGYTKEQMTAHGFRSMASTLLNENGFNRDWIERQLAHVEGNSVRAAYNYAEHLQERRKMMQWWADYLDQLRAS